MVLDSIKEGNEPFYVTDVEFAEFTGYKLSTVQNMLWADCIPHRTGEACLSAQKRLKKRYKCHYPERYYDLYEILVNVTLPLKRLKEDKAMRIAVKNYIQRIEDDITKM